MQARIDKIDFIVLKQLLEDGRISYSSIAKETNLTDVAIKKRVESLKRRGILNSIKAEINYEVLGFEKPIFIQMRTEVGKTEDIMKKLNTFDYVMESYQVLGEFNILGKLMIPDIKFAEKFIKDISKLDGIIDLKTLIVLTKYKESNSLPSSVLQKTLS